MKTLNTILLVVLIAGLFGCAGQVRDEEAPKVTINSFKSVPNEGKAPRFEIGLHITNPSRNELTLQGLSYTLKLAGNEVLNGVSNQLPVIEPYGEADVMLYGQIDLIGGIRLVTGLIRDKQKTIPYQLKAKLDPGGFRPNIYANREGVIDFSKP
jgi:LEA14-like dessication related protein